MTHVYERDPAAIYAASFAIVRAEARLAHLPEDAHGIAVRVAHACGMPDVTDDLALSPGAAKAGRAALADGAPVLVDAMMVAHGIIAPRLPAGNEVVCTLNDPRTAPLATERVTTRSAAQVELWGDRLGGAVVAIGNAPTALFRLMELIEDGAPRPALVIGMAVGFVGAAESKEALIASGLPHVVVRGRRGGSAMAAAAVNALARDASDREPLATPARRSGDGATGSSGVVRAPYDPRSGPSAATDAADRRVVVLGADAGGRMGKGAREALARAETVFGPRRLLDGLETGAERVTWPSPLARGLDMLEAQQAGGRHVAVIASGDPMHFGIGAVLAARLGPAVLDVRPSPSAFSLAAARLGWALEGVACVSLHGGEAMGRGVATLAQHAAPGRRVIALTTDGDTPGEVAAWLTARGFGASRLAVLERMGAADERVRGAVAEGFALDTIDPLNTLAIECVAASDATWHPLVSGLPDDAFAHDGQLTKAEIRALTVARLMPRPGATLWDVGAGSGSVGLEWLRLSPGGRLVAIEPREDRRAMIAANLARFGLRADIVAGEAPAALRGLPAPDVAFVGGGVSMPDVAEAVWAALPPGGTIGANAVTLEGEARLAALHAERGGTLTRLAVQRAEKVGPWRGWRAAMPLTLWSATR